jgi:hypothetical protein
MMFAVLAALTISICCFLPPLFTLMLCVPGAVCKRSARGAWLNAPDAGPEAVVWTEQCEEGYCGQETLV